MIEEESKGWSSASSESSVSAHTSSITSSKISRHSEFILNINGVKEAQAKAEVSSDNSKKEAILNNDRYKSNPITTSKKKKSVKRMTKVNILAERKFFGKLSMNPQDNHQVCFQWFLNLHFRIRQQRMVKL